MITLNSERGGKQYVDTLGNLSEIDKGNIVSNEIDRWNNCFWKCEAYGKILNSKIGK